MFVLFLIFLVIFILILSLKKDRQPPLKTHRKLSSKGQQGENITSYNMRVGLDSSQYRQFNNVIIETKNGTTQIDHIVISRFGIFIIETKNLTGWIFGDRNSPKWTQILCHEKYLFQNPLRQTYRQKKTLAWFFNIKESTIHTVICFVGDCEFKTDMPENIQMDDPSGYIKDFNILKIPQGKADYLSEKLNHYINNTEITLSDHIRSLHQRHNSTNICPSCGARLLVRTVKKGPRAGTQFLGCANYLQCRFSRNIE
ncbi:NERD domain-containing protein [Candidatus Haliotispira prima]|uniref:NERD domain-containing protein n=1 Tax=Candidatus Haliotispira prima TaxID=3034016 RepID=A0ABY8MEC9_9SPIO|nr:NERD domain-containing protein [Candidatus Haliotispira prima]